MPGITTILISIIAISIVLIAIIVFRPSITATRGGKVLAFVALLVFPVLAGGMGVSEQMEHSKTTGFCLSCHVMEDYGKSLHIDDRSFIPAVHFQNGMVPREQACFTCHTNYTMYGDLRAKLRGLRHVYAQYLGTVSQPIKLYTPYNNRECLHCHLGSRSFEEGATHNQDPQTLPKLKANQLSCTTSECHNLVHNVSQLKDAKLWQEAGK
ncbi:MAG TPA: NapC/NirT family cytochrome c [Blastocatellia bacterium]|nr:NapC/NirT family cytochrome c [Blastocatellia bacterium]